MMNSPKSKVNKFNYLRFLLEGSASEAVWALTLSAANHQDAINILKKRFGNRQLIVSKYMETHHNIDPVTSEQNLWGLRKLYNDVEANTRSLKALGVEPETYRIMLASVLLGKLTSDLHLIVSRKISNAELTLDTLQWVMEEELTSREGLPQGRGWQTQVRPNNIIVVNCHHVQQLWLCYMAHTGVLCAATVNNLMPLLNALLSLKYKRERRFSNQSGRCFNFLCHSHIAGNASHRISANTARRNHISICEARGIQSSNTVTQPAIVTPTLNPDALPFESTSTNLCTSEMKSLRLFSCRQPEPGSVTLLHLSMH